MCKLCETKPVYEFTNKRKLCARCFINYFQKKVLYTIRKFKMIKNGDVVGYENDETFRGVVLEGVLKMFGEKGGVELVEKNKKKVDKIAISSTIDEESRKIIETLIEGKEKDLKDIAPVYRNIIKLLYLFLDEEVLLYAKLRKLKFNKKKEKKDKISEFLDELEKKHPEVKRAVVNGYLSFAR